MAIQLATPILNQYSREAGVDLAFFEDQIFEHPQLFVLYYQTKSCVNNEPDAPMLGGNAPIIVDRMNGDVHIIKFYLEDIKLSIDCYLKYKDTDLLKHGYINR